MKTDGINVEIKQEIKPATKPAAKPAVKPATEPAIKVSVLLPSLNVAKYIGQCVQSVTEQTLKEIEIICIDAGSTDGTRQILEDCAKKDGRITVIDSPVKSYGYQMNLGIDAARGEYIGILETDDFVDAGAFEDLYRAAAENNADVVRANYYEYREETGNLLLDNTELKQIRKRLPVGKVFNAAEYPELLLQSKSIWSGICKKEFLVKNSIRFLESKGAAYQDIGFFFKTCLCAGRIMLTDKAYLHYRLDNEASSVNTGGKVFAVCDEHEELDRFLRAGGIRVADEISRALTAAKAGDYFWNFQRVPDTDKKMFAERMQKDFSCIPAGELMKNEFLSGRFKKDLRRLLDDSEAYVRYRRTFASRFVHCLDANGLRPTLKKCCGKRRETGP